MVLIFVAVFAALAGLTVPAASRRPRIGVPGAALFTAGAVALVPLVWVTLFPLLAVLVALVAVCGGVLLAANVRGAVRSRRRAREAEPVRPALVDRRHDLGGHTITVEDGPDGRTVVERSDGWLMKVVRTERELAHGETVLMVARAAAWTYGAEYVSGLYGSASSARADLAVDNILGGGR